MPGIATENELEQLLKDGTIAEEIRASAKKWWMDGVEEGKAEARKHLVPVRLPLKSHNPYAQGAGLDGQWSHFGEYLGTVRDSDLGKAAQDARLMKAALAEGAGETGGFLVPEEFRATLLELAVETAFIRPRAFVLPMGSNSVRIPTIRDTTHASNLYGGVSASWQAEGATLTESEPTFAQVALNARKLTGYTVAGNELLADSAVGLEALLTRIFGTAITWFEEEAFINGTGAGEPRGIVGAPVTISVSKETGQAANTIVFENINKMYSRMLPSSRQNAVWIAHIDTFPQLATMSLNVGTGGSAVMLPAGGAVGAPPMTIWGRPVIFTEHAQTLGTVGDLIFADLSYYVIGDRQALQIAASSHVRFTTDETVWRFTERLDGRPWLDSPLTPKHGTNTLSPFVTLATRA